LTQDGVDAWLDKAKLLPGQDWELEIRKAVREADVVVVCLSKQFNQAGFRQKEVRLALDTAMEKPEGEIFIIPARLEECDTLESLRKWHWVDLYEDDGYKILMRALQLKLTGISSGIDEKDLSVQYEKALKETVEPKYIETEVQLSREIQKTFIPESLPDIEGWDFASRWKTAHNVGGDFYDVIKLPNNNISLFISDVSGSGIPAALFMALVRTLIRAASKEFETPAEVIHRVNELLISDPKQKSFATAIYAVLDVSSNELIYANAGHNPPLWVKQNHEVERLVPTGMALGITDGLYGQQVLNLSKGDILLFYTDGLTEAFNHNGDLFGEERLVQILLNNIHLSVDLLIVAVEKGVLEFVQDKPLSDDLTMLAIRKN
jgi:serine phosphatase RsbU (regulator of sigma subunit)